MGITGDRYVGTFEGHEIVLIRDNFIKTLELHVDGKVVASERRWIPKDIHLTCELEIDGTVHEVVAKQELTSPFTTNDTIEIDGMPLALKKTK